MVDKEKLLEDIGLSKNKAKIYLALLNLGSATAEMVSKKSGIHRRNVYDSLENLLSTGLINFLVKDNKRFYRATNPYFLLDMLEEEKEKLKKKEANVLSAISELLPIHNVSKNEDFVSIHKGVSGVKFVLDNILKESKPNLVLGAHEPPLPIKNHLEKFHEKRIRLGIKEKLLFNKDDRERALKLSKSPFTKIRFIPKKLNEHIAINIYGDKVAIIMWSNPVAVLIENKNVAENFRQYFKILWEYSE